MLSRWPLKCVRSLHCGVVMVCALVLREHIVLWAIIAPKLVFEVGVPPGGGLQCVPSTQEIVSGVH